MSLVREFSDKQDRACEEINERFPPDPPHESCHHAVILGYALLNSTWVNADPPLLPAAGEVVDFFRLGGEQVRIWTPGTDQYSLLLIEADPKIVRAGMWRTAAVIMELMTKLKSMLEHQDRSGYAWIYHFNPMVAFEDQHFLHETDRASLSNRRMLGIEHWFEGSAIMELLIRDEKFFVAAQLLCSSFQNHSYCLECALRPIGSRRHHHDEPDMWNLAAMIPSMEIAIVQATRAVEALLGEPGDRKNPQKLERARERWRKGTSLDPDKAFGTDGSSYFEYYYELFNIRNDSAHSRGNLSPELTRAKAVAAQNFAYLVVLSRLTRVAVTVSEAFDRLEFNRSLVENAKKGTFSGAGGTIETRPVRRNALRLPPRQRQRDRLG